MTMQTRYGRNHIPLGKEITRHIYIQNSKYQIDGISLQGALLDECH